jgi:iron-sulfur cluster repair protein YtfE (RIC family)
VPIRSAPDALSSGVHRGIQGQFSPKKHLAERKLGPPDTPITLKSKGGIAFAYPLCVPAWQSVLARRLDFDVTNGCRDQPTPTESNMDAQATNHQLSEQMHREHESLREKLGRIHDVFQDSTPALSEIKSLLHDFEEALTIHFSNEENEGFFDEVTNHSPALESEAARLCVEHRELQHEAAELRQFATAGCPSILWWRELASRCHAFSQKLMQHECTENRLLQIAYRQEVGVVD